MRTFRNFPTILRTLLVAALACLSGQAAHAAKQARGYSHAFERGNLVPNWSFETLGQTWDAAAVAPGFTVDPRFKMSTLGGSNRAVTGTYAGRLTGTGSGVPAGGNFAFHTPYLPLRPTVYTYVVSFYYKGTPAGNVRPALRFYRERNNPASQVGDQVAGEVYTTSDDWKLVTFYVYPPYEGAQFFRLALAETQAAGHGGTLYFDDVVMEEFAFTPRNRIQEQVVYGDALGRPQQVHAQAGGTKTSGLAAWSRASRIRVNTTSTGANIRENLSNFPLLVRLDGVNFNFTEARANGEDIRFTDGAGNVIPHEIEMWNTVSRVAAIWVRVPVIEGSRLDNDIYMYWGNASAPSTSSPYDVFNEYLGYNNVYHMATPPIGVWGMANAAVPQRTAWTNNMDGTAQQPGRIGYNLAFDGVDDRLVAIQDPANSSRQYSFSAWVKLQSVPAGQIQMLSSENSSCGFGDYRSVYLQDGRLVFTTYYAEFYSTWKSDLVMAANNSTYYHVAITFDDGNPDANPKFYINGSESGFSTQRAGPNSGYSFEGQLGIGSASCSQYRGFKGSIDEFRLEGVIRSPSWLKLAYEIERPGANAVTHTRGFRGDVPTQTIDGLVYDSFGRATRANLPCNASTVDLVDPLTCQTAPDLPNMGGFPYAESRLAAEPGARVVETGLPGAANSLASGHSSKSDYYYVNTLDIPANIETPAASAPNDTTYMFRWSKNPDGNYTLTWANRKGQLVQTALNTSPMTAVPVQWARTRYEYHRNGTVKRMLTPLDVATSTAKFALVSTHNTLGQTLAKHSPDKGLVKFWYNRDGQIRFTQDAAQRAASGQHTYYDYDAQGRLIAKGTIAVATMTQAIADLGVATGGTKSEKVGYIYDDLSTFSSRIGFTLASIMPATYIYRDEFIKAAHGYGRVICKYNRNGDNPAPYSAQDKFVAEFFLYNRNGQVERVFKYFGPLRGHDTRYQDVAYYYDPSGRIETESVYENAITGAGSVNQSYAYDDKGRLKKVTGDYGTYPIVEFSYMSWGPVRSVILGGDGSGSRGTRIDYAYHTLGGIKEIKATRLQDGKVIYQQFLGYDGKADPATSAPANPRPRFSGAITQQLYKLGTEANLPTPIRLANYNLDELGRMLAAEYQQNAPGAVTNADGTIKYPLTWQDVGDLDSYFSYDANGRITSQRSGGATTAGNYVYKTDSYRLDYAGRVSPTSVRTMSAGNFEYNGRGAMTYDRSLDLSVEYGWDLLPTRFVKNARSTSQPRYEQYQFYDADGQRVSKVDAYFYLDFRDWLGAIHYSTLNGRTYKEMRQYLGSDGSHGGIDQMTNLFGNSQAGRIVNGRPEFFLKNNQGSLMMTVDKDGYTPSDVTVINDYTAYGYPKRLVSSAAFPPSMAYTGKEFEDLYALTYYGARFFDPELGVWISVDPAGQHLNPYSYGGDPVNFVDPTGLWKIGLGISVGWTRKGGFSLGLGVGASDLDLGIVKVDTYAGGDYNLKDGSTTYSAQVGAQGCLALCLGAGVGGSYNTESGYALNSYGSVGIGLTNYAQVGLQIGTGQYWTKSGDYIGGDVYGEVYAQAGPGRAALGANHGFGAIQGGVYGKASFFGASVNYHTATGLNFGTQVPVADYSYDVTQKSQKFDYIGKSLVEAIANYQDAKNPEKPELWNPDGEKYGYTNWCGPGGGGGNTGPVDAACYSHDMAYERLGAAGKAGAFLDFKWDVVAADWILATRAMSNMNIEPHAGLEVGALFLIIASYKTVGGVMVGASY